MNQGNSHLELHPLPFLNDYERKGNQKVPKTLDPVVPEIPFKGDAETIERIKVEKMTAFSGDGYW